MRRLFAITSRYVVTPVVAIVAIVTMTAAPAQAATVILKNVGGGQHCVQDAFSGGVSAQPCGSYNGQRWQLLTGPIKFQNIHTQKCLQDSFANGLRTETCGSYDGQQWVIRTVALGTQIENVHTDKCLRVDGFAASTGACSPVTTSNVFRLA